jgi:hypothetical protein
MLKGIMLNIIKPNVIMLYGIMLNVITLNVIILNVPMMNFVALNDIMSWDLSYHRLHNCSRQSFVSVKHGKNEDI